MAEQQIVRRIRNRLMEADIGFALMFQDCRFRTPPQTFQAKTQSASNRHPSGVRRQCRHIKPSMWQLKSKTSGS